ncbi:MAG: (Na+)-NQR maturation NqrM [Woeseiaceae bacterium]|nr:(Na+)-NQR maturation NqrM [Woeseiaceae bacterium]
MNLAITFIISFLVIAFVVGAMAIGVMAGRAPIRGSCGGLNGAGCELCGGDCPDKDNARRSVNAD